MKKKKEKHKVDTSAIIEIARGGHGFTEVTRTSRFPSAVLRSFSLPPSLFRSFSFSRFVAESR